MKIITKIVLKDLIGRDIPFLENDVLTVGKAIANTIVSPKRWKGSPIKAYKLAQKLYEDEPVEVDKADLVQIKNAIEADVDSSKVIVGQILDILEDIKEDEKEVKK